jgi:nitrite reductase/ring-hydroxylating ferredoxin subunit
MEKLERKPFFIATKDELKDELISLGVGDTELVIVNHNNQISVYTGLCLHEEALLADGFLENGFLTCGKHLWRYKLENGELDGEPGVGIKKLDTWFEGDNLYLDLNELERIE